MSIIKVIIEDDTTNNANNKVSVVALVAFSHRKSIVTFVCGTVCSDSTDMMNNELGILL